jgi:hypothetical protein
MHMETGSLVNLMAGGSTNPEPTVGMGATILMWTDRKAATIVEVKSATTIVVQEDKATRTDGLGMTDAQEYEYEPDADGTLHTFTKRKSGAWVRKGEALKGGQRIALGYRRAYHDFSF